MDGDFEVRTGSIAIGDPAMGLVIYELGISPGRYRLEEGALLPPEATDVQVISLDGPYLFVLEASLLDKFLEWFHRVYDECGYVIPRLEMRLGEAAAELGAEVAFYWEQSLSGYAQEGTYALDPTKIVAADEGAPNRQESDFRGE